MPVESLFIFALVVLILFGWLCHALLDNPRGDMESGVLYGLGRLYVRLVHRLRIENSERFEAARDAGPLIVIANHTAGVDPILIQARCPFEIRWMMAEDMRARSLEWFWSYQRVIFVDRDGGRNAGLREALRHLRSGGVLGIFPEGGLERPPSMVLPFQAGVGLLIRKSGARVLPLVLDGTPQVDPAWSSLWRPSNSRVSVMPMIDYAESELDGRGIAEDLRARYLAWTGWPANETPGGSGDTDPKGGSGENSKPPKAKLSAA